MMEEIWKDIEGYEGYYQVSNLGRVKSFERVVYKKMYGGNVHGYKRKGRVMNQDDANGYMQVQLSKRGKRVRVKIHRLVAIAFLENKENKPCINHIDADRSNNNVTNLEWCTQSENVRHSVKLGRWKNNYKIYKGSDNPISKLTESIVRTIRTSNKSNAELGRMYGVTRSAVRFARIGKNWKHVTA